MAAQDQPADEEGFGRKLLSFFIKDDKEEPPAAEQPTVLSQRPLSATAPAPVVTPQPVAAPGAVDNKFLEHFAAVCPDLTTSSFGKFCGAWLISG